MNSDIDGPIEKKRGSKYFEKKVPILFKFSPILCTGVEGHLLNFNLIETLFSVPEETAEEKKS